MQRWIEPKDKYENPGYKLKKILSKDEIKVGMFIFWKGEKFVVQEIYGKDRVILYLNYYNMPGLGLDNLIGEYQIIE